MQLTQTDIEEFKAIYRKHYGHDLPDDEAWSMARNLIHLFRLITEPLPDNDIHSSEGFDESKKF
jgi:hypothetical protein